jgi:hypothetical protein
MYGVGLGIGEGAGEGVGVGVGVGVAAGDGLGVGVGVGDKESLASVPHRLTEPIATLRLPVRSSVRRRLVIASVKARLRETAPDVFDVTARRRTTREPRRAQRPR